MNEKLVIDELRDIDILMKKNIFKYSKDKNINYFPSPLQERIIIYLIDNKDSIIYQKDLERELNVSKVTISETLNKLEKNGIIIRESSEFDARNKQIKCCAIDLDKREEMKKDLIKLNDLLVMGIDIEELKIFISVLSKIKLNLKKNLERK